MNLRNGQLATECDAGDELGANGGRPNPQGARLTVAGGDRMELHRRSRVRSGRQHVETVQSASDAQVNGLEAGLLPRPQPIEDTGPPRLVGPPKDLHFRRGEVVLGDRE